MNILIIGNGFDLAHGLPTKYWDFLMFVKCIKEHGSLNGIERANIFGDLSKEIRNLIYNEDYRSSDNKEELLEFLELIKDNIWIEYFIDKIQDKDKNKGWIDFELEISQVIKSLDYLQKYNKVCAKNSNNRNNPDDSELFNQAYKFLDKMKNKGITDHNAKFKCSSFYDDIANDIIGELNNELNNLIRCLEIYLDEFVAKIDVTYASSDINEINKIGKGIEKVLSFNYTKTYKNRYDLTNESVKYDYVHGKINSKRNKLKNDMVLGIDEYLEDDKKDKELDFIQFKKYFQRIYKKTGCEYRKWVEEMKKKNEAFDKKTSWTGKEVEEVKTNLYIFGHSLDVTDKDILKELIMLPRTTTTIYYYNDAAYKQYIVNLVKLIGQDELTDRVHGLNPRIIFKKQQ